MAALDPETPAGSLRRLRSAGQPYLSAAVDQAVQACAVVFRVSGAGLMIADEMNVLRSIAATDGPSSLLEKAQSEAGTGPCVEAFVTNQLISSADLRTETRWPAVTPTLTQHGVLSVLGSPLRLGGVPVGTLDVYRDEPHEWDQVEQEALAGYGDVIESTLSTALAAHQAGEVAGQLQYALDYRVVIERAVGFLMARHGLDAITAFDALRRTARDQRRKVAEVAAELLATGSVGPPPPRRR